jgi:hypothetical protein
MQITTPPTQVKTQHSKLPIDMQVRTKLIKTSLGSVAAAALLCFAGLALAQTAVTTMSPAAPATTLAAKPLVANKTNKTATETWDKLTVAQKTALQPLYANWSSLSEGHKRKWIAVSANFAQFSPEDKTKLHSRMTEWAGLSAKQREQARINFAQTKELTAQDKQAKWESYKALPPETKQALANIDVAPKPTGAATAAKPVAKDKLVASTPKTDKATVR